MWQLDAFWVKSCKKNNLKRQQHCDFCYKSPRPVSEVSPGHGIHWNIIHKIQKYYHNTTISLHKSYLQATRLQCSRPGGHIEKVFTIGPLIFIMLGDPSVTRDHWEPSDTGDKDLYWPTSWLQKKNLTSHSFFSLLRHKKSFMKPRTYLTV